MGRPYPNRPRKRPGKRLPDRFGNDRPQVRPSSFLDFGTRPLWDLIAPGMRGRERRQLFNRLSSWNVLGMGLLGGFMGWTAAGPVGAILGFVVAVAVLGHVLSKHRFYRP
jgi:hypothetical protein